MTQAGTEVELSQATLQEFARMASALDEYDAGGMDSILGEIFSIKTLDDYKKIFDGDRELPQDKMIQINRVRYSQSEFAGGLPFYLVVDGVDLESGEVKQWVSGSITVVAMLVRAAASGHLPCKGFARESDKPTKNGFRPVNWNMRELNVGGQETLPEAKAKAK